MIFSISLATKAVNKLGCKEKESNGRIKIKCPVCAVAVVRRGFRRHYETMHCAQDPVSCQFCQKSFKHRYSRYRTIFLKRSTQDLAPTYLQPHYDNTHVDHKFKPFATN